MHYMSSVRLRFIRRTNDETNYCRTVDKLIWCDNCSSFKTGARQFGVKNNKTEIVDAMLDIEQSVQQVKFDNQKSAKQAKLTNFFSPLWDFDSGITLNKIKYFITLKLNSLLCFNRINITIFPFCSKQFAVTPL